MFECRHAVRAARLRRSCLHALVVSCLAGSATSWAQTPSADKTSPPKEQVTPAKTVSAAKGRATSPEKKGIVIDRVAAIVGETILLESEVVRRARGTFEEIRATGQERLRAMRAIVRRTLDEMIDEELIVAAAADAKLVVKSEEIDRSIDDVKKKNELTDDQFEKALGEQGFALLQYRQQLERQILRFRAISVLVRPRVQVTDEDVRAQYDRQTTTAGSTSAVRLQHILVVPPTASADDAADARRKAGDIVARARAGEAFDALVRDHSDDTGTKETGGDLGWFSRGDLPAEWEDVVFAMTKGEVRGPVRGATGWHVFLVSDTKRDAQKSFEQAKEEVQQELFEAAMEKQTKLWLQELRKKTYIEIKL